MAELRKFLFENEFDAGQRRGGAVAVADDPAVRQLLAVARQEGLDAGRQAGRQEADAERARIEAEALARIAKEIAALGQRHAAAMATLRQENLALALAIGRKLAHHLIAAQPLAEIEGVVEDCLRRLLGEARLVIRVHDSLLDALQGRVDVLTRRTGFAGQVILLAEDGVAIGDCRVEWADGGATRTVAQLDGEIDALIARALGGSSPAGAPTAT